MLGSEGQSEHLTQEQGNLPSKVGLTFPIETQILEWLEGTLKII